jgi:hypothetical protein
VILRTPPETGDLALFKRKYDDLTKLIAQKEGKIDQVTLDTYKAQLLELKNIIISLGGTVEEKKKQ